MIKTPQYQYIYNIMYIDHPGNSFLYLFGGYYNQPISALWSLSQPTRYSQECTEWDQLGVSLQMGEQLPISAEVVTRLIFIYNIQFISVLLGLPLDILEAISIPHRIHGAGIYANIGGILMVNVTIYSIRGSYGYPPVPFTADFAASHCDSRVVASRRKLFARMLQRLTTGNLKAGRALGRFSHRVASFIPSGND